MKKYIYNLLAVFLLTACNDIEPGEVHFDISVEKSTVQVGEPVIFNFNGNPDYITIYSGDDGHKYANREKTEIDASDIEKTVLTFNYLSKKVSTGHKDHFNIYLSTDFPGMNMKDAEADNKLIHTHAWKDITVDCLKGIDDYPTATNIGEIDLSDYANGVVLAFRYQGAKTIDLQRTVAITGLKIINTLKNGKKLEVTGSDIEFSVFDTYPSNGNDDPYLKIVSGTVPSGTWGLTQWTSNTFRMIGSTRKDPVKADNDDWLISEKIEVKASCDPDKGEVIKDMSRRLSSYTYTYDSPGIYTVTFLAGNVNIEGEKSVIKELQIEVVE